VNKDAGIDHAFHRQPGQRQIERIKKARLRISQKRRAHEQKRIPQRHTPRPRRRRSKIAVRIKIKENVPAPNDQLSQGQPPKNHHDHENEK
jgi:hypothetical protein